jgi:hypothetical protein
MILIAANFKNNYAGNHLAGQIIRSGTSQLNYGLKIESSEVELCS